MRYDLNFIHGLCSEVGLAVDLHQDQYVEIDLGMGAILFFQNADQDKDCLIGFRDTPWHTHDDLDFYGGRGYHIEMSYLDLLSGLAEGKVLVCERRLKGHVVDRWLVHCDYNDELKRLEEEEEIVVRRAAVHAHPGSSF